MYLVRNSTIGFTPTPFITILPKATRPHTFRGIPETSSLCARRNATKGVGACKVYRNERCRGFTILELLLVLTVAFSITALTTPVGIRFFQTQSLDEATAGIFETMRRSHNQAVFQKNDSAFGVKFLSGSYVLFQGSSYVGRIQSEDENFSLSVGITTSGIDEVVFAKQTGTPSTVGTITITSGNDSQALTINAGGKIEKQ